MYLFAFPTGLKASWGQGICPTLAVVFLVLTLSKWKSLSCVWLCNRVNYTVHGILQARILKWVAFPFSRGSSQPKDHTQASLSIINYSPRGHKESDTAFYLKLSFKHCSPLFIHRYQAQILSQLILSDISVNSVPSSQVQSPVWCQGKVTSQVTCSVSSQ